MKNFYVSEHHVLTTAIMFCLLGTATPLLAQGPIDASNTPNGFVDLPRIPLPKPTSISTPLADPSYWPSSPIEWSSSQRQFPQWITNLQSGEVTFRNHSVIEVGNGLNYIDSNGTWQQSQDLIELTKDGGAAALQLPNKVFFDPTLSTNTGIRIVTMSNLVFTTCPVGLYFYDRASGKEALLASLQNGVAGKLVPPNRVIYPGAFQSAVFTADLRVTVTKGALECDTVITRQPKVSPQTFSMDPATTLLQVRHVWTIPAPPALSVGETPDGALADSRIDFGHFRFVRGRAFEWDGAALTDTNTPAQIELTELSADPPVGKTWQTASPNILSESVLWASVQPKLAQLPLMAKTEREESTTSRRIELAADQAEAPAFVLDYKIVTGTGDYTFNTYSPALTNTYWLQSSANFGGTVTFNPGCIIKRAPGTTLTVGGLSLVCNGTCSQPSIITVQDDNMYGEQTGTNCASTDSATAFLDGIRGASVTGMNIRYAGTAIAFYGECCTDNRNFKDSTVESCQYGLYANNCNITIANSAVSCTPVPTVSTNGNGTFSGAWGSTCNQVSLHGVVVAGMQNLLSGKTPSVNTLQMYSLDTNGWPTNYSRNCWIHGLKGLTSQCVCNSSAGLQFGGVLITSKHVLTAAHIGLGAGVVMQFIGKSGTNYIAMATNGTTIVPPDKGDVAVLTLDRDLPNDVETIKVLPYEAVNKMTFDIMSGQASADSCLSKYLPCVGVNQGKGAYVEDLYYWIDPAQNRNWMRGSAWFPSWMNGYEPGGGDSGHPIMAVINNELVLVGNWSAHSQPSGFGFPETLGTSTGNSYNCWFGFNLWTTNTLVVDSVGRWNVNAFTCNQSHTVAFFNSVGTNLGSIDVTAVPSNYFWSLGGTLTNGGSPGGLLTLLGAPTGTNYYLLSQEFQGGDHWYYYPGTTMPTNASDFIISGAAASPNLSNFVVYANSSGYTFGPLSFSYYPYPHTGLTSIPGSFITGINQCLATNGGGQYSVNVFDVSVFPNHQR